MHSFIYVLISCLFTDRAQKSQTKRLHQAVSCVPLSILTAASTNKTLCAFIHPLLCNVSLCPTVCGFLVIGEFTVCTNVVDLKSHLEICMLCELCYRLEMRRCLKLPA